MKIEYDISCVCIRFLLSVLAMAALVEDCPAADAAPLSDKEVIFDGCRMRFEPGDIPPSEPQPSPVGRLRAHQAFWLSAMRTIRSVSNLTLSIVRHGYRLQWNQLGPPDRVRQANHPSTHTEAEFVSDAVRTGIDLGTWKKVDKASLKCIMPLGVAVHHRTGKKRMIFDCRHLNRHLQTTKFKMESLHVEGRSLFQQGWWGGTIDLTSAYYHVEMHPDAYEYLGFEWNGCYNHYTVLPFGISTAPYIFTHIMKTTVGYMRSLGLHFLQYLDDLPFAAPSAPLATAHGKLMLETLCAFGWIVHIEKCIGI